MDVAHGRHRPRQAVGGAQGAVAGAAHASPPARSTRTWWCRSRAFPNWWRGCEALADECALPIVCFGHAGNGNLHVNILYDPDDADESARAQAALPRVFALALSLGGTLSGEHGIGLSKRDVHGRTPSMPATLALMRAVKRAFDPDGILNPGKLLPDALA